MNGWRVKSTEPVSLHRTNRLANMYVLSPFVRFDGDRFHLFVRAVPRRDDEPRLKMAEIWHGVSSDGLTFEMDIAPILFPGPDLSDLDGCEDPTVVVDGETLRVWYTGYNQQQQTGRLLFARGPDCERLSKAGLALDSTPDFANPKESTIVRVHADRLLMYFEYARDGASLIGQASADDLDGPWGEIEPSPIAPRPMGLLAPQPRTDRRRRNVAPDDVLQWRNPGRQMADRLGRVRSAFRQRCRSLRQAADLSRSHAGGWRDRHRLRGLGRRA